MGGPRVTRTSRARGDHSAPAHPGAAAYGDGDEYGATAARDASRRACFAARKSLNHAWVAWVRAAGGTLGSCDVHRGALQCILRCLKATVMRQTILCWRKAAHCVHYEPFRDVWQAAPTYHRSASHLLISMAHTTCRDGLRGARSGVDTVRCLALGASKTRAARASGRLGCLV